MVLNASPSNLENNEFALSENSNGDLVLEHKSTGATFRRDRDQGIWVVDDPIAGPEPSASGQYANKSYVDTAVRGLEWKESVINEQNNPATSPSDGDRYVVDDNPTGDWSGHPNQIAEYDNGSNSWKFITPNEGWAVFIEVDDRLVTYDGTNWVKFGSTLNHGVLGGLGDDDHTQYLLVDGSRSATGDIDAPGYTINGDRLAQSVLASGQATLSSGSATVDTGLSATDATFQLALGVDDPNADTKVSGRLFWDDSAGTYKIEIVESDTSVGNPTVNYDIVRVR